MSKVTQFNVWISLKIDSIQYLIQNHLTKIQFKRLLARQALWLGQASRQNVKSDGRLSTDNHSAQFWNLICLKSDTLNRRKSSRGIVTHQKWRLLKNDRWQFVHGWMHLLKRKATQRIFYLKRLEQHSWNVPAVCIRKFPSVFFWQLSQCLILTYIWTNQAKVLVGPY